MFQNKNKKSALISAIGVLQSIITLLVTLVKKHGGTEESIYYLATPDGENLMEKIAKLIANTKQQSEITNIIFVDYSRDLPAMITAGVYDLVNGDITSDHFPFIKSISGNVKTKLFYFNKTMTSKQVITEMDKSGWIPAESQHLLAFGEKYPLLQKKFPIIALGSRWQYSDVRVSVIGLWFNTNERVLGLRWYNCNWNPFCRFLAVRKSKFQH